MSTVEEHLSTSDFVAGGGAAREEALGPLFPPERAEELRARWDEIQTGFVDEPRKSVKQADEMVAEAMKQMAEGFAAERARLEQQWARGGEATTEDLRQALRRYRAFFQRLLAV